MFAPSFCSMWAAGGLSAPHKNRQCPPNELLFFSLSEFRNERYKKWASSGTGMLSDEW